MARVDVPGFDPCLLAGEVWGRRAVTRRRRRHRARLPGRRAVRRARGHGCERPSGRHTPVPSRVVRFNLRVMKAGRLPPADRAPATRRAAVMPPGAFRRTHGVRAAANACYQKDGPSNGLGPKAQLFFLAGRRSSAGGNRRVFSRLLRLLAGLRRMGQVGPKPRF
jgi:hypothetical protein